MDEKYLDPEIERLTELYEKDPTSRIFAPLADAYRKSKLYDEAIDILKKGLEIHPNYVSAELVLARCYYEKDMLQLAKSSLEKVLTLDQQNLIALKLLGDIFDRLGDKETALEHYKKVAEIDPTNLEVQAILEKVTPSAPQQEVSPPIEPQPIPPAPPSEAKQEEPEEESKPEFSELVETPEVSEIVTEELPLEKEESTSEEKEEAAEPKEPGKSFVTPTLAEIYEEQGFFEKALDVYKQLLKSHPDNEQIKRKVEELTSKIKPESQERLEKTEESFTGLLSEKKPEAGKKPEKEKEEKKVDFSAFKQWLEGLTRDEKTE